MEILIDRACGIDVHKATVVACIMGTGIKKEIRTYTTMTNDLLRLKAVAQRQPYHPRGNGEHRGLLETGVQHLGR